MLDYFDESVLDDPEFKEDAVREEIIAPVLKALGYSLSPPAKIVRSRALTHPYVHIGSKQQRVSIVPDYLLEIHHNPAVVLDAKSPHESLEKSKHAEQVYSYAIHPEVRAPIYSLCNGKRWIVWDIDRFEPVANFALAEIKERFDDLARVLCPDNVLHPEKRTFLRDFGLTILKMGIAEDSEQIFIDNVISALAKVEDNLYSTTQEMDFGDEKLAMSFDMSKEIYLKLLSLFPADTRHIIEQGLSRQPYTVYEVTPIHVSIYGRFGALQHGQLEDFVPINVHEITPLA